MKRLLLLLVLAVAALPARAHFIWVLPPEGTDTRTARIIYSDTLKPDTEELLKKIEKAEVFARGIDGKTHALKKSDGKQLFKATAPDGPHEVGVVLHYGVSQHGDNPPVLLNYYAKGFTGIKSGEKSSDSVSDEKPDDKFVDKVLTKTWDKLPFDILPVLGNKQQAQIVWQGKPVADAEVMLYVPGQEKPVERKTDKDGLFTLEKPEKSGVYGIRARHIEKKEGELDGKKYKEVRHYATMTFAIEAKVGYNLVQRYEAVRVYASNAFPVKFIENVTLPTLPVREEPKRVADPAATKLLADARNARALWDHFPGFSADVEVNLDGKTTKGTVTVDAKGHVELTMPEGAAAKWASGQLRSIVSHRLGGADLDTPCAFADDVTDHPLGRAIVVLNDEYHSSYRIKERQILVVNRAMPGVKFTIAVLENRLDADKKYLPSAFVVNTWDATTGALRSSETFHQDWKRVGKFDLPAQLTEVTASAGKLEARSLTLTKQKLP